MIYSLTGELLVCEPGSVVISCGGVGFHCIVSGTTQRAMPAIGQKVSVFTHMNVTQDAITLYGFSTKAEMSCFRMLTGVSGIGSKTAIAVLTAISPEQLAISVAAGDAKALTAAPGIGPKQAQRIVLELKDKISGIQPVMSAEMPGVVLPTVTAGASTEASKALVALGYSQTEAAQLVSRLDQSMTVEQMIAAALRAAAQK
ncbi:MAG: Holliday junction branch migration protein RuvA [Ruminococcaceae bacterium]|nr:Holliday junction branch migration protein RuvA [Oscillospiraceae bacterium]